MVGASGGAVSGRAPRSVGWVPPLGVIALAFVFVTPLGLWLFGRHIRRTEGRFPGEVVGMAALYVLGYLWLEFGARVLS